MVRLVFAVWLHHGGGARWGRLRGKGPRKEDLATSKRNRSDRVKKGKGSLPGV